MILTCHSTAPLVLSVSILNTVEPISSGANTGTEQMRLVQANAAAA